MKKLLTILFVSALSVSTSLFAAEIASVECEAMFDSTSRDAKVVNVSLDDSSVESLNTQAQ